MNPLLLSAASQSCDYGSPFVGGVLLAAIVVGVALITGGVFSTASRARRRYERESERRAAIYMGAGLSHELALRRAIDEMQREALEILQ